MVKGNIVEPLGRPEKKHIYKMYVVLNSSDKYNSKKQLMHVSPPVIAPWRNYYLYHVCIINMHIKHYMYRKLIFFSVGYLR